jgi:BMFP domain-containing protein YqiC
MTTVTTIEQRVAMLEKSMAQARKVWDQTGRVMVKHRELLVDLEKRLDELEQIVNHGRPGRDQ